MASNFKTLQLLVRQGTAGTNTKYMGRRAATGQYTPNFDAAPTQQKGCSFGSAKRVFSFIKDEKVTAAVPGPLDYKPEKPTVNTPRASFGSGQRTSFAKIKF